MYTRRRRRIYTPRLRFAPSAFAYGRRKKSPTPNRKIPRLKLTQKDPISADTRKAPPAAIKHQQSILLHGYIKTITAFPKAYAEDGDGIPGSGAAAFPGSILFSVPRP